MQMHETKRGFIFMSETRMKKKMYVFYVTCAKKTSISAPADVIIEGYHVTSDQANFGSHHTRDRHVGFLSVWDDIEKNSKMFHHFLFICITLQNYNRVPRISAHTHSVKMSNSSIK